MGRFASTATALAACAALAAPALADVEQSDDGTAFRLVPGIIVMSAGLVAASIGAAGCLVIANPDRCIQGVWRRTVGMAWDFTNGRDPGSGEDPR